MWTLSTAAPWSPQTEPSSVTTSDTSDPPETSVSVFDDDDSDVASNDDSEDALDSGPDTVSFDFLEEQTNEPKDKDDDLTDFLGQFGD